MANSIENKNISHMKKYKNIPYCLIVFLLSFLLSSSDNVLDQNPVDSFNEVSLFQDIDVAEAFLHNVTMGWTETGKLTPDAGRLGRGEMSIQREETRNERKRHNV